MLYIPHGSDERWKGTPKTPGGDIFISHMVQMKETFNKLKLFRALFFISHMVQMKESLEFQNIQPDAPLYPTWFR